jgi:hypothetical protein
MIVFAVISRLENRRTMTGAPPEENNNNNLLEGKIS